MDRPTKDGWYWFRGIFREPDTTTHPNACEPQSRPTRFSGPVRVEKIKIGTRWGISDTLTVAIPGIQEKFHSERFEGEWAELTEEKAYAN